MNKQELTLSDGAIAMIAKTLQLAILTGTDIVDNLRLIRFTANNNNLNLSEGFNNDFEQSLIKLQDELESNIPEKTEKHSLNLETSVFSKN